MSSFAKNDRPVTVVAKRAHFIRRLVVFAMLGTLMFCSKILMEFLPNIHLIGALTITYTLVYRWRAIFPIYVFVMLNGLYMGFSAWWVPYLYIWTVLWGITLLLPKRMPRAVASVVYPVVCMLHGFAFGTLYSPVQALLFGLDFQETVAWIVTGLPWDAVQGLGNLVAGLLICPLSSLLSRLSRKIGI